MTIQSIRIITALGTPLTGDESLHVEGLRQHLEDQWNAGVHGVLVGGSMGLMQMLRDETYDQLVAQSVEASQGRGEILVGVGDTGLARTRERIERVRRHRIDGVVVLTPFFQRFSQELLLDYFRAVADSSPAPVYLYDLPAVTHVAIEIETYAQLVAHPNIRGAKISGRPEVARQLLARWGDSFRTIVADPDNLHQWIQQGVPDHLDGIYSVAPQWTIELVEAAARGDRQQADARQQQLRDLRTLIVESPTAMGTFTAMMNARGIDGQFHAAPWRALSQRETEGLLSNPLMQQLIAESSTSDEVLFP